MKKIMRFAGAVIIGALVLAGASVMASSSGPGISAEEALKSLMDGNKRYVDGKARGIMMHDQAARNKLVAGQKPYAIILSCSDSRVPPELVFDKGLGEIFVVRVAGNVVEKGAILGSIEYAAEHLGVPLVMVLGHEKCGAVKATVESKGHAEGNIGSIVAAIAPAIGRAKGADPEDVADANLDMVKENLTAVSPVLAKIVAEGRLKIVTGKYHMDHGDVVLRDGLK
ncbi:MAG: carbonic anhydrase [Desulfatitalea sp.]